MNRSRRIALAVTMLAAFVLAGPPLAGGATPAPAPAAAGPQEGLHFLADQLTVAENAGAAEVTVTRSDTTRGATVGYATIGETAQAPYDYTPVRGLLTFAPGQATASFGVPIVDHGIDGMPKTIKLELFGAVAASLGTPATATLTIVNDDPVPIANAVDPLDLPAATTAGDPLAGAHFFVDPASEAARAARTDPTLKVIADQPGAARFGSFSYPNAGVAVARYLARAAVQQPGAIPMLTTYRIVDGHCGGWADPPSDVAAYHSFVNGFARGIGTFRAVLFLEQDSLITVGCLSPAGLQIRMQELTYAIDTLTALCPHLVIYLDAGAADAVPAPQMAQLLLDAGVAKIQGFFLDATHFDWTLNEIAYGEQISRLIGGKHFVVSTGESGRGPLVPRDRATEGNEVLCNPPGRGLGPLPTTSTGYPNVDAFAWLDNPGGSSGPCRPGAPAAGVYWPAYALMLIRNADFTVR
jgi:endoglucanase